MQISYIFFFREKRKLLIKLFEMLISAKYKFKVHRQTDNKKVNLQIQYLHMRQQFIYSFYKCIAETDIHNVCTTNE